jgi:hypothetical protein
VRALARRRAPGGRRCGHGFLTPGATVRFTDAAGAPASDVYVRYHYDGHLINPVHPVTYIARGSVIVGADALGRATIPGRMHLRRLFPLSMPPRLFIDHVYLPRLHNAFGPIAEGTTSRPGVFCHRRAPATRGPSSM